MHVNTIGQAKTKKGGKGWKKKKKRGWADDVDCYTYKIAAQVIFLFVLEALEVLEHAGAGVLDVALGNVKGLFELWLR